MHLKKVSETVNLIAAASFVLDSTVAGGTPCARFNAVQIVQFLFFF